MRSLIWSLVFLLFQTWLNRLLGVQKNATIQSGFSFMEAAELGARRLLVFAFKAVAAGIAALIGLYFVLQTLRNFLEQDLGWDPTGTAALFAVVFLGAAAVIVLYRGPKTESEKLERQLPPSIGSATPAEI